MFCTKPSCTDSCTSTRVAMAQPWPAWNIAGPDAIIAFICEVVGVEVDADRLAAQLEEDALQVARRRLDDLAAGGDAAGEAHLVDARVAHQGLGDGGVLPGHEVDHAGRQVGLRDQLGEEEVDQRAPRRRLEHHGAARRQRGPELLHADVDREVPGGDHAAHADRLAVDDAAVHLRAHRAHGSRARAAAPRTRRCAPARPSAAGARWACRPACGASTARRAGLGDEELAHLLLAALHRVGDAQQRARAILARRARPRPLVERAPRRRDGAPHVVDGRVGRADRLSPRWPDSAPRTSRRSMRSPTRRRLASAGRRHLRALPCARVTRAASTSLVRMSRACRPSRGDELRYDLRPIADSLPSVHCARRTAPDDPRLDSTGRGRRRARPDLGRERSGRDPLSRPARRARRRVHDARRRASRGCASPPRIFPTWAAMRCRPSPTSTATASPTPSSARTPAPRLAFRNAGTAAAPRWERRPDWDVPADARGAPALGDLDGDGDADLLVGDADGGVTRVGEHRRVAARRSGARAAAGIWRPAARQARPALGDVDGDGRTDLVVAPSQATC